jgi:DNA-binding transcriptional ArsR family regulator
MKTECALAIFESLSSESRLDVFRLLVKYDPEGLVAGEISRHLDIPATNLSFHLKAIVHSGLAIVQKEGRYLRYRANIPLMLELIDYLTSECCQGYPERCGFYRTKSGVASEALSTCCAAPKAKVRSKGKKKEP